MQNLKIVVFKATKEGSKIDYTGILEFTNQAGNLEKIDLVGFINESKAGKSYISLMRSKVNEETDKNQASKSESSSEDPF